MWAIALLALVALGACEDRATIRLASGVKSLGLRRDDAGVRNGCEHTRADAVQRTLVKLDANRDECISLAEMERAFDQCLYFYERWGLTVGQWFDSVETPAAIMHKCDADADGRICFDDMRATGAACDAAPDQAMASSCLCNCKANDGLFNYVLSRHCLDD